MGNQFSAPRRDLDCSLLDEVEQGEKMQRLHVIASDMNSISASSEDLQREQRIQELKNILSSRPQVQQLDGDRINERLEVLANEFPNEVDDFEKARVQRAVYSTRTDALLAHLIKVAYAVNFVDNGNNEKKKHAFEGAEFLEKVTKLYEALNLRDKATQYEIAENRAFTELQREILQEYGIVNDEAQQRILSYLVKNDKDNEDTEINILLERTKELNRALKRRHRAKRKKKDYTSTSSI